MPDPFVDGRLEPVRGSVERINLARERFHLPHAAGWRERVGISDQDDLRARGHQADEMLHIDPCGEHARHVEIDSVPVQAARLDEIAVARHLSDGHGERDPVVQGADPRRAGPAERDPGRHQPRRVDVGPRAQVVERQQVVAHDHAPQRAAFPQELLVQRHFGVGAHLTAPGRSLRLALAE